ncbi:931_t:CDS:1, partial [Acaulospora colombiana]
MSIDESVDSSMDIDEFVDSSNDHNDNKLNNFGNQKSIDNIHSSPSQSFPSTRLPPIKDLIVLPPIKEDLIVLPPIKDLIVLPPITNTSQAITNKLLILEPPSIHFRSTLGKGIE